MTFLRLLSSRATQNFTYTCSRSAGWYDETLDSFEHALRFQGANEEEFAHGTLLEPEVLSDECKVFISKNIPFIFICNYDISLDKVLLQKK